MEHNNREIAEAATIIAALTLVARLLGFARDWLIYTRFGESYATDAFNAAFSIPDFIYLIMIGGALSSAFIPVLTSYFSSGREEEAWETAGIVINFTMMGVIILIAAGFIFARPLLDVLAPRLPVYYKELAVFLSRIMFIQTFFMALNGLSMGVLNSRYHFTSPALGGLVYNLGIILVGIALVDKLGIAAFSYGVVAGAIMNFIIQLPALIKTGFKYRFSFNFHNEGFLQVITLMFPVLIGLSASQLNLFVSQNIASGLAEGSITALRIAQRIMQLPVGIFAGSIAMAVFPTLTAQVSRGEIEQFKRTMVMGLRGIFYLTIPAGIGLIAVGYTTISLMFEWNNFSSSATLATSQALIFYALGLFAYAALTILNRIYYSLKDTVTPVLTAILTIAVNIGLSLLLVHYLGHLGLALAYSVAGIFNMLLLLLVLRLRIGPFGAYKLVKSFIMSLLISAIMYFISRLIVINAVDFLDLGVKLNDFIALILAVTIGAAFYAGSSLLLRMEEAQLVWGLLSKRLPRLRR